MTDGYQDVSAMRSSFRAKRREREGPNQDKITGSGLPGRGSSRGLGTPSFDTNFASWNCADTEKRRRELEALPVWTEVKGRRPPSRRTDRLDAIVVRAIELQHRWDCVSRRKEVSWISRLDVAGPTFFSGRKCKSLIGQIM